MDSHSQEQQNKDFMSLFPQDNAHQHAQPMSQPMSIPMFPFNTSSSPPQHGISTSPTTQLILHMQGLEASMMSPPANTGPPGSYNPHLLEQQIKLTQLQQLQQLQNQIFQQQIALISGQQPAMMPGSPSVESHQRSDQPTYNGLPTPGSSTELRPQQTPMEFVSPITLNTSYMDHQQQQQQQHHQYRNSPADAFSPAMTPSMDHSMGPSSSSHLQHHDRDHLHNHFDLQRGAASAPEHIAFRPHNELDLDISPLTSPWLGAHGQPGPYSNNSNPDGGSTSNKRTASSSGDEAAGPSRKKPHSPAIHASNPQRRSQRMSKSTSSTPLLRSTTRSRNGSLVGGGMLPEVVGDTPSPVDMPPPAPPMPAAPQQSMLGAGGSNSGASSSGASIADSTSPMTMSHPTSPVFGASPVDVYHQQQQHQFGAGNGHQQQQQQQQRQQQQQQASNAGYSFQQNNGGFQPSSPAFEPTSPTFEPTSPMFSATQHTSSSNPPMTPVTPASIMNLGRLGINSVFSNATKTDVKGKGRAAKMSSGAVSKKSTAVSPSLKAILPAGPPSTTTAMNLDSQAALPGPVMAIRKTSHKAAEQKRRDSMKSTYDTLRQLLPPISLPTDVAEAPILPGALPPRGPPKAGGEGPNKAVSKLQLLICGNEYIKTLKGRVERRDEEIGKLRKEVRRLRLVMTEKGMEEDEGEEIDLEKDLDAVEALRPPLGRMGLVEGGGGEDGDEEGEE